jgi:hypothetical protein
MSFLDEKAKLWHYLSVILIVLGMWYLIGVVSHGNSDTPLANTTVDVTSLVVFGG